MSKVVDKTKVLIEPILEKLGYEIFNIEYKKEYGKMALYIYIDFIDDRDVSVSLDDCERVHYAITDLLDEEDITNGESYNLNISSPGLDRPLLRQKDYERNINKEVDISLYKQVDKLKKITATLLEFNDESITVKYKNNKITILKENLASIKQAITF